MAKLYGSSPEGIAWCAFVSRKFFESRKKTCRISKTPIFKGNTLSRYSWAVCSRATCDIGISVLTVYCMVNAEFLQKKKKRMISTLDTRLGILLLLSETSSASLADRVLKLWALHALLLFIGISNLVCLGRTIAHGPLLIACCLAHTLLVWIRDNIILQDGIIKKRETKKKKEVYTQHIMRGYTCRLGRKLQIFWRCNDETYHAKYK